MLIFTILKAIVLCILSGFTLSKEQIEEVMAEKVRELERVESEDLCNFSSAIPEDAKKNLLDNEAYYRQKYRLRTMTDETYQRLLATKTSEDVLQLIEDEPMYRIIEHEEYCYDFQYVTPGSI